MTARPPKPAVGLRALASLRAAIAGWAAATILTLPIQFPHLLANTPGGVASALAACALGSLVWAAWSAVLCFFGWMCVVFPVAVLVSPRWLLRHPRRTLAVSTILGWSLVLFEFRIWRIPFVHQYYLNVRLFSLYSVLFSVFALATSAAFLRSQAASTAEFKSGQT